MNDFWVTLMVSKVRRTWGVLEINHGLFEVLNQGSKSWLLSTHKAVKLVQRCWDMPRLRLESESEVGTGSSSWVTLPLIWLDRFYISLIILVNAAYIKYEQTFKLLIIVSYLVIWTDSLTFNYLMKLVFLLCVETSIQRWQFGLCPI